MAPKKVSRSRRELMKEKYKSRQGPKGDRADRPKMIFLNPRFKGITKNIMTRRFMERQQKAIHRLVQSRKWASEKDLNDYVLTLAHGNINMDLPAGAAPLEKAQDLAWRAWDTEDPGKRLRMAQEALEISRDCADGYVLVGNDLLGKGRTEEALRTFREGVEAGRRGLGKEVSEDPEARSWGNLDLRPFLRALLGLAQAQRAFGRIDEALGAFKEILRWNGEDNQGSRFLFMDMLMEYGRDQAAWKLLEEWEEDLATDWLYYRALLTFRKEGDATPTRDAMDEAIRFNGFAALMLLGLAEVPPQSDCVQIGSPEDAASYVHGSMKAWKANPEALDCLGREFARLTRGGRLH